MNRALISVILLIALSTKAGAQSFTSPAYIQQIAPTSASVRMTTSELMQPIVELAMQMPALQPSGPGNLGLVWQQGSGNQGTVSQFGSRNVGLIQQIGLNNVASITQRGIGHQAMVSQQGNGNVAIIRQR
ncbi:hypothetical protein [Aliihoeflea sp. 40Bstr573]|uniref:hypothetical protein n=1 Tax=Aliihoeflea sp. 40Bstr573 TaxID=2696467 RepID=UPI00209445F4|nr:hypothetical protein [Aliihoeflea sp. 40Bstr573]MCO6387433.1 hypothetical protein [Aliihoeflea sp. 40Bstr573]